MIVTVTTAKDTLANLQRFVAGNLGGGVDHCVVLLDAPDPEVEAWLAAHPHVTHVVTDESWWRGERPDELNVRQRINANLVKAALTLDDWAEWLFHVDADEVAWIDRAVLARAPAERRVAKLVPLEAVSLKHWEGDPTLFKRLAAADELAELYRRGVVDEPVNGHYFHGHPFGKVGVRPCLDLWLTLHSVQDAGGERVAPFSRPRLRMLHYESYSGEDFVRKWTALLGSGQSPNFRSSRRRTAEAIRAVLGRGLSEEEAAAYLMKVFEETTEDDVDTLRELGLLVEVDPRTWSREPESLPADRAERLTRWLERLRKEPKGQFHPGQPVAKVTRTLERISGPAPTGVRRLWRRS